MEQELTPYPWTEEAWKENTGDLRGWKCVGWAPCAGCQHSMRDLTCKLTGQFEGEVCNEGKRCPHMKPRPPKPPERVAWELKELDKACELPEKEWREWEKKHPGYGRPWYYPDGY